MREREEFTWVASIVLVAVSIFMCGLGYIVLKSNSIVVEGRIRVAQEYRAGAVAAIEAWKD